MDVWSREEELIRRNAAIDNRHGFHSNIPLRKSKSMAKISSPEKRTQTHLRKDAVGHFHKSCGKGSPSKREDHGIEAEEKAKWSSLSKELAALKKEKSMLQSKLDRLSEGEAKRTQEATELKLRLGEAQRTMENYNRDLEEKERSHKRLESQNKALSVRLERQEETIAKLRNETHELKEQNKNTKESFRSEKEEILRSTKNLERNFEKMTLAYSKQQDLVEVLKKQKLHLEAAQVLQFTEEEFVKALNWNTGSNNVKQELQTSAV